MTTLARAEELVASFEEQVRADLADAVLFDAHTHLGDDIDGTKGTPDELLGMLDRFGVQGAFVFCLDEPDRDPAFRAANDRTLAYAAAASEQHALRLDLECDPLEEARRCLDLGARGIKLHPRHSGSRSETSGSRRSSRSRPSATCRS